jgi:hypothetical protein
MQSLCFFILLFSPVIAYTQSINSKVVDSISGFAVSYATIGFIKANTGFSTYSNGHFSIPDSAIDDTIIVSSVGYTTRYIPVKNIAAMPKLRLVRNAKELDQVVVKKRTKTAVVNKFTTRTVAFLTTMSFTQQAAQLFESPDKNSLLQKVQLRLHKADQPYSFRLRFYDFDSLTGAPGTELYPDPIQLKTRSEKLNVNLEKYHIVIPGRKFFISVEWIIIPEHEYPVRKPDGGFLYFPLIAGVGDQPCSIWILTYRGKWETYHCSFPKALKIEATISY